MLARAAINFVLYFLDSISSSREIANVNKDCHREGRRDKYHYDPKIPRLPTQLLLHDPRNYGGGHSTCLKPKTGSAHYLGT
jgi:hypothetical protein